LNTPGPGKVPIHKNIQLQDFSLVEQPGLFGSTDHELVEAKETIRKQETIILELQKKISELKIHMSIEKKKETTTSDLEASNKLNEQLQIAAEGANFLVNGFTNIINTYNEKFNCSDSKDNGNEIVSMSIGSILKLTVSNVWLQKIKKLKSPQKLLQELIMHTNFPLYEFSLSSKFAASKKEPDCPHRKMRTGFAEAIYTWLTFNLGPTVKFDLSKVMSEIRHRGSTKFIEYRQKLKTQDWNEQRYAEMDGL
jgi:hypothetical protein